MYKKRNKLKGSIIELFSSIYLYNKNYIILDINYYTKWGEVDVIALDYNLIIKYINKNIKNNRHVKNINYKNNLLKISITKTTLLESYLKTNFKFLSMFTFNDILRTTNSKQLFNQINSLKKDFIFLNNKLQSIFIKLIKKNPEYFKLVFVEIKFKSSNKFGSPEDMISTKKVKTIHRLSTLYPHYKKLPKRLDVITVSSQKHTKKHTITNLKPIYSPYFQRKFNSYINLMSLNNSIKNNNMKKCDKHEKLKIKHKTLKIKHKTIKINDLFFKKVTLKHYKNVSK